MRLQKPFLCVLSAMLLAFTAVARAQQYTSIVVFGDSLSDTGNDAYVTEHTYGIRVPGLVADYANNRFTDGRLTTPAARDYFGVWVQQLAKMLPDKPEVKASLHGGTNYAYGFATTGSGTSPFTFGPSDSYSVTIDNMGQQITDYLATHPKIDKHTLFVVWGGAINVLYATNTKQVIAGAVEESADVQRLVDAGGTQFLVVNLPPLGDTPRLNGSPTTAGPANEASVVFNDTLSASLDLLQFLNFFRPLNIHRLDTYSLFNSVIASPAKYALDNVTGSSQGDYLVDPDTYLFWDDLHPTTHGHEILALTALKLVDPAACAARDFVAVPPTCDSLPAITPSTLK
jgi:phospholipase/lecithinase/hemolysin